MLKSLKVVRLAAGAAAAILGGLATPAWATYGGGACHRCSPAPVVATQLNVVSLAPQVETSTRLCMRPYTRPNPSP